MRSIQLLLAFSLLLTGVSPAQSTQDDIRSQLSRRTGVPIASLGEVSTHIVTFKTLGITLTRAKAIDTTSGQLVSACWDAQGQRRDFDALRLAEIAARKATPTAKIDPRLQEAMAQSAGGTVRVGAWLTSDTVSIERHADQLRQGIDQNTPRAILRDLEISLSRFVADRVADATGPFVDALEGLGRTPRYVSTGAPVVFFDATSTEILALAAMEIVDTLYLELEEDADLNEDAKASHRTDRVHAKGVNGRDVEVAMLEDNGVDPNNPWLSMSGWYRVPEDPDDHIHGTSGNVGSTHPSRGGSAPGAKLYSANAVSYSDSNVMAAGDWALASGSSGTGGGSNPFAEILNGSFGPTVPTGVLDMMDRYWDYRVRSGLDNVVLSAGNAGIGQPVGHAGWNILLVGAFNNGNTGDWDDDAMSTFSCTANPSTGCEKPNVVASGTDVDTLGDSNGFGGGGAWLANGYNGTSFSAPFASANLANTMVTGVGGGSVSAWPTAGIALMMATAWNNIEGSSRLSDQDGAGAINGLAAVKAAQQGQIINDVITATDFTTGTFACSGSYYVRNIWLKANDRARVCIAWLSNANSAYTTDTLDADLDLAVYAGQNVCSGTSYGFSSSFNNNFEIVEFTPPTTGWYSVRVNDFSFAGSSEDLSIAWSQKSQDSANSAQLREYTGESSTYGTGPTIGRGSYYMDWSAPNSPNCGDALCAAGENSGAGYSLGGGSLSPLSADIWFDLWLAQWLYGSPWPALWSGSLGTTNSSGESFSNRMTMPNYPNLVGIEVDHIGLCLQPGYPGNLKELTEVHTFKFWPLPIDQNAGDDTSHAFTLPFPFEFYGNTYTEVFINSNGNLTFGSGDSDFSESEAEMLSDQPRIAALWDDLSPNNGGNVFARSIDMNEREVVIEWMNVPQFGGGTDDSTVRVILRPDNSIRIQYRDVDVVDCLVGISPGNGASSASEIDLSANGFRTLSGAIFERFSGGGTDDLDLTNDTSIWWSEVKFTPTNSGATTYRIETNIDPR